MEAAEQRLRAAYGRFPTGVAFVTAEVGGAPLGLIVSSFTAVSLEPPLVSFCPARDSLTWHRMRASRSFTVHVLGEQSAEFARHASTPGVDRFAEPVHDVLAVIDCDREAEYGAGDHWIVVGRVRALYVPDAGDPLVYFAGRFGAFHPHETELPCPQTSSR
jgi:3-hydroxy-9,10-secoandrosta-1,3,5(10)-triene-9,17-dione monooxygenase reductase component